MAISKADLIKALEAEKPANKFTPYCFLSKESDCLTVYFEGDPDYSERLSDHVTLYRSIATKELVGCRIKGISGIIERLPNYIGVNHDGIQLALVFVPFMGGASEEQLETLDELAREVQDRNMVLQPCG
jgi:hypothetical protein